jgi:hypothetical protein
MPFRTRERQRGREAERQRGREAERQRGREAERQRNQISSYLVKTSLFSCYSGIWISLPLNLVRTLLVRGGLVSTRLPV